jgi:hypothetical protein
VRTIILGFVAVVGVLFLLYNPHVVTGPLYGALDVVTHPDKHKHDSNPTSLLPVPPGLPGHKAARPQVRKPQVHPGGFGAGAVAVQQAKGL